MTLASRDLFMKSRTREYGTVETPIGTVRYQSPTEGERVQIMEHFVEAGESGCAEAAHIIALCVVDADGDRLFSTEDIEHIMDMPSQIIRTIYDAIDNQFGVKGHEDNGRIEEAAKN